MACVIITAILFGIYPNALRAVYRYGGDASFMVLLTAWGRALSMIGYCLWTRKALFQNRADLREAIAGGFFQALAVIGITSALMFLQGPLVTIIVYTYALMLLFFTAFRGETKLTMATFLTMLAAFGGLTLVLDLWNGAFSLSWMGVGLAFIAALATANRIYIFGKQSSQRHPIVVGAECLLVAALLVSLTILIKSLLYQPPHLPNVLAGYGWAVVDCLAVTIGGFTMFYGISLLGSFRWGLFSKIEPIFTSLFSIWFLGEFLKWQQYTGILVVLISLALYQIMDRRYKNTRITR